MHRFTKPTILIDPQVRILFSPLECTSRSYKIGFFGCSQRVLVSLMVVYKLDKSIDTQRLISDIQKLVTQFSSDNPNDTPLLVISVKKITHDDTSLIPKLEYKTL